MLTWYLVDPVRTKNLKALETLRKLGKLKPESEPPEVWPNFLWLWQAFCLLSEKRMRVDGCPQPIPFSEIMAYASYELCDEERERLLVTVVTQLDRTYMADYWKRSNEEWEKIKAKQGRR